MFLYFFFSVDDDDTSNLYLIHFFPENSGGNFSGLLTGQHFYLSSPDMPLFRSHSILECVLFIFLGFRVHSLSALCSTWRCDAFRSMRCAHLSVRRSLFYWQLHVACDCITWLRRFRMLSPLPCSRVDRDRFEPLSTEGFHLFSWHQFQPLFK